jgi:hypothetical protein
MARTVPAGAAFAYQVAVRTLDEQLRRIEALDTKAGVLIAADGLVIGLLSSEGSTLAEGPAWVSFLLLGAIITSLVLALLAFTTRRYETAPNPDAAIRLMAADPAWLEWRFLGNMRDAIGVNRGKLRTKTRLLSSALTVLIAGIVVFGGYSLVHAATKGT